MRRGASRRGRPLSADQQRPPVHCPARPAVSEAGDPGEPGGGPERGRGPETRQVWGWEPPPLRTLRSSGANAGGPPGSPAKRRPIHSAWKKNPPIQAGGIASRVRLLEKYGWMELDLCSPSPTPGIP